MYKSVYRRNRGNRPTLENGRAEGNSVAQESGTKIGQILELLRFKAVVPTTIQLRFDCRSTSIRPRYDHSTTYAATGLMHCVATRYATASLLPEWAPCAAEPTAAPADGNVAAVSHAQYVSTLTAAAACA